MYSIFGEIDSAWVANAWYLLAVRNRLIPIDAIYNTLRSSINVDFDELNFGRPRVLGIPEHRLFWTEDRIINLLVGIVIFGAVLGGCYFAPGYFRALVCVGIILICPLLFSDVPHQIDTFTLKSSVDGGAGELCQIGMSFLLALGALMLGGKMKGK